MASKTIKGSPNSIQHMFCQDKNFIQTDDTFQSICNFLPLHELCLIAKKNMIFLYFIKVLLFRFFCILI